MRLVPLTFLLCTTLAAYSLVPVLWSWRALGILLACNLLCATGLGFWLLWGCTQSAHRLCPDTEEPYV